MRMRKRPEDKPPCGVVDGDETLCPKPEIMERMMPYRPKLDLKGATPEALVRALFRRVKPLRPARVREPVVGDEVAVEEPATDEPGDGIPHLRKRP